MDQAYLEHSEGVLCALYALQCAGDASRGGSWTAGRIADWMSQKTGFAVPPSEMLVPLADLASRGFIRRVSGTPTSDMLALGFALAVRPALRLPLTAAGQVSARGALSRTRRRAARGRELPEDANGVDGRSHAYNC
jgi:hypothetical protein